MQVTHAVATFLHHTAGVADVHHRFAEQVVIRITCRCTGGNYPEAVIQKKIDGIKDIQFAVFIKIFSEILPHFIRDLIFPDQPSADFIPKP